MKTTRREFFQIIPISLIGVFSHRLRLPNISPESNPDEPAVGLTFDGVGAHFDGGWVFEGTKLPLPTKPAVPSIIYRLFLPFIERL